MRPIIGIFPMVSPDGNSYIKPDYVTAIERAGGRAILLPVSHNEESVDSFIDMCDGFVLPGGPDIEPVRYGEKKNSDKCFDTVPERDEFEFFVFPRILASGKPMLGICRGSQLMNTALGGTLYQDIPTEVASEVAHREGGRDTRHEMNIIKGTRLYDIIGKERININSYHHQAVKDLGNGLRITARSEDGIIEAVEGTDHPYLHALQWHPDTVIILDEDAAADLKLKDFYKEIFENDPKWARYR